MLHSFGRSLARSYYLSLFPVYLSVGFFYFSLLMIARSSLLAGIKRFIIIIIIFCSVIIGWLVDFYGISTLVGYLMPNPVYTYILNLYDL